MFVHYSCEDLQDLEWTHISSGEKFNTGYYYRLLVAAEVNMFIVYYLFEGFLYSDFISFVFHILHQVEYATHVFRS
jgi:hypothetical protein